MLLLSDGRVMAEGGGTSKSWSSLTPDATGGYINGTWSTLAPMNLQRLYFGSNVLPSGKVLVLGGEYSGSDQSQNIVNSGQIYDPVTNTWTSIPSFPQPEFGDDPTVVLPSGQVLAGYIFGPQTYLYNPTSNSWSQTGSKLRGDRSDEETWVLLPDGSVLSYDIFSSPASGAGHAQRYLPASGTWVDAGSVPVVLTGDSFGSELGPAMLLPDGRVFQIGANGHTAIYTPSTNSWVAGPNVPGLLGADDAPGAILPNGHVIFAADTPKFHGPTKLFDFNPLTNSITDVTPTGALGVALNGPAFIDRMLVLPSGDLLLSTSSGQLWDYTPSGSPNPAWAPTVSNVTQAGNIFTLTGTQLTGLSAGASYGDDAEMDSNYPIVRITDSNGTIKYATTFNWTPGVATGSAPASVQFTMPVGLAPGVYHLSVIANGIASADFVLGGLGAPQNVTAFPFPTTQAFVSWSPVQNADGYRIYLYDINTHQKTTLLGTYSPFTNFAFVSGLAPGAKQYLVVEAYSAVLKPFIADSIPVSVSEPLPAPFPTVTLLSPTSALLSWAAVAGAQGYRIFAQLGGQQLLMGTFNSATTSITLVGLTPGTTIQFMVEAFNGSVVGDSGWVSVTTMMAFQSPDRRRLFSGWM